MSPLTPAGVCIHLNVYGWIVGYASSIQRLWGALESYLAARLDKFVQQYDSATKRVWVCEPDGKWLTFFCYEPGKIGAITLLPHLSRIQRPGLGK